MFANKALLTLRQFVAWFVAIICAVGFWPALSAQTPEPIAPLPGLDSIQLADLSEALQPIDGKRVALVIGNSDYSSAGWADLENAAVDAEFVARLLADPRRGDASFDVELVSNGSRVDILAALERFAAKAKTADIAIVYYGGHGFEFNLDNYIVPIDAPDIVVQDTVGSDFINMSDVVNAATAQGFSIFFLDACRTSGPIIRTNDDTSGNRASLFGAVDAPQSVVFYATAIGDPAYDAAPPGTPLSPFARAVAAGISVPGLDVPYVFSRVRDEVGKTTQSFSPQQIPQFAGSWSRPFFFLPRDETSGEGGALSEAPLVPLDIPLETLSTVDEPILVVRLLEQRSANELLRLAESGDPLALYIVGFMYADGVGFERDDNKALEWLERAAETGHPAGQLELASFLLKRGVEADKSRAEALLRSAADAGYAKAKSHLAAELGWLDRLPRNRPESDKLLLEAAELGHAYAIYALALRFYEQGDQIDALHRKSREGNVEGDHWLCQLGTSGVKLSHTFDHCLIAARSGYASSRAATASFYLAGEVVERSISKARYWAQLALASTNLNQVQRATMEQIIAQRQ